MATTNISTRICVELGVNFRDYYREASFAPAQTFARLMLDHRKLRFSIFSLCFFFDR